MVRTAGKQKLLRELVGSALLVGMSAVAVMAVCRQPHPRVCTEFYDSAAVFTGKVVAVRNDPHEEQNPEGWFYRIRVEKSFRGPSGPFIEVYTGNDSARFPLEKNRSYLLFAYDYDNILYVDCCGNSGFLKDSAELIHQIEEIQNTRSGGEIAGRVGWGDAPGFAGVRIVALGKTHTYETRTDAKGRFHMKVPEGEYRVRANAPGGGHYLPFDLTYDNPDHIVVQPGGCPQMQFMPQ